jgi:hypothetical protein
MTSIPFVGKDVPSSRSEFAHPDVVISLTILGFRYEGLRKTDFKALMKGVQQTLWDEDGPYERRPSARRFAEWVKLAGGRVRGSVREEKQKRMKQEQERLARNIEIPTITEIDDTKQPTSSTSTPLMEIWPLRLIDFDDQDQFDVIYNLLYRLPHVVQYYLSHTIFPDVMRHQNMKISACGQELGGEMLFARRLGFSGTPSDLLPLELGKCHYEKGSDGKMLSYLTSPVVSRVFFVAEFKSGETTHFD